MLDELGVLEPLMERGLVSTGFQYRDRRTGPIADLDLGVLAEDTRFPFRVQLEQSKLTPIILEVLAGMDDVTVHFDQRVVSAETDRGHRDGDDRGRRHLHRRLGAGCRRRQLAGAADRRVQLRGDDLPRAVPGGLDHRGPGDRSCRASRRSTTSSTRPSGWCCCAPRSTGGSSSRPTRTPRTRSRTTRPGCRSGCAAWPTSAATGTSCTPRSTGSTSGSPTRSAGAGCC